MTITLLPGNHDYDLACVPEYKAELARYNVRLEPVVHITRAIAGRTVWIEHGNQYDDFNRFPDFGNRYGLPIGYFITRGVVASAGRSAERTKAKWLDDVQSVYPNEDIPFWVLSSHFYKEMTPLLRWGAPPLPAPLHGERRRSRHPGARAARRPTGEHLRHRPAADPRLPRPDHRSGAVREQHGDIHAADPGRAALLPHEGYPRGDRPLRDRHGRALHVEKDAKYVAAAQRIFAADPSVELFVYGHTHIPSLREVDRRYIINTGSWLKRLDYVPVRLGRLPGIYVPSYQLNYFELTEADGTIRIRYRIIPKTAPNDLTLLERLLILGRRVKTLPPIPPETRAGRAPEAS